MKIDCNFQIYCHVGKEKILIQKKNFVRSTKEICERNDTLDILAIGEKIGGEKKYEKNHSGKLY